MEKEFVPYDLALRMKQLGFNEYCFAGYRHSKWIGSDGPNSRYFHAQQFRNSMFDEKQNEDCSSPLYQQAFRWFREKRGLYGYPFSQSSQTNIWFKYFIQQEWKDQITSDSFNTHEEAELACLKKLIEIVEEK
jgi:2-oxoglutarate dehydrogenase complex dehydrogenase (E1) component-like enzyme